MTQRDDVEIFYVDDMEDEILITQLQLRRGSLELHVQYFLSGDDVLAALYERLAAQRALPGLIVADLNMPGITGLQLIGRLKTDPRLSDIVIGVCTGSENPADRAAALEGGADFVMIKPFNLSAIERACRETGRFHLVAQDDRTVHLRWRESSAADPGMPTVAAAS